MMKDENLFRQLAFKRFPNLVACGTLADLCSSQNKNLLAKKRMGVVATALCVASCTRIALL